MLHLEVLLEVAGIGSGMAQSGPIRLFRTCPNMRKVYLEDMVVEDELLGPLMAAMVESGQGETPKLSENEATETVQISMYVDWPQPEHNLTYLAGCRLCAVSAVCYDFAILNQALTAQARRDSAAWT